MAGAVRQLNGSLFRPGLGQPAPPGAFVDPTQIGLKADMYAKRPLLEYLVLVDSILRVSHFYAAVFQLGQLNKVASTV